MGITIMINKKTIEHSFWALDASYSLFYKYINVVGFWLV